MSSDDWGPDSWHGPNRFRPKPEGWEEYQCPLKKAVCNMGKPNGKPCKHWVEGNPFTLPNPKPSHCRKALEAYQSGKPWK